MSNTRLPKDLVAYLADNAGKKIEFSKARIFSAEVREIEFRAPSEIELTKFHINTWEYYHNHGEEGEDPDHEYEFEACSLLKTAKHYDPDGILVYIPFLREFGTIDTDHALAYTFPYCGWGTIELNLAEFVNCGWYPGEVDMQLFRPWADLRCSHLRPKPPS